MTKLNIVGNHKPAETFAFNQSGIEKNELNMKANGGTELMQRWLMERLPPELANKFQIICSRVRHIDPNRIPILWLHDLAGDPEAARLADPEFRKQFAKLVFVSNWQMQQYATQLNIPYSEGIVIKNAIVPIPEHQKPTDKIRLIYHTTPHRGLNIVVAAFEELAKHHTNIELDVYSSFKLYGWEERDKPYEKIIERCKTHPQINYHGAVSNDQVREALQKAHIFAYPSIWPETSCIALIEAMSAGCITVCPNFAALPETAANFAAMYQYNEDVNVHANLFVQNLNSAIVALQKDPVSVQEQLRFQKIYYDAFYSWDSRIVEWVGALSQIAANVKQA